jgi:hypothetical protein
VLHDELVLCCKRFDHVEHSLERLLMRAEGDEDQKTAPSNSAFPKCLFIAGHCTKNRSATG